MCVSVCVNIYIYIMQKNYIILYLNRNPSNIYNTAILWWAVPIWQVELVSTAGVEVLSAGKESAMVGVLQEFFTSRRDSYYRDPLFFFSLFLHNILPDLTRVILLDIDIKVSEVSL